MLEYMKCNAVWLKYCAIRIWGILIDESVIDWFGSTYVVYGNVVKKVR
jgi:hypothetical protein